MDGTERLGYARKIGNARKKLKPLHRGGKKTRFPGGHIA